MPTKYENLRIYSEVWYKADDMSRCTTNCIGAMVKAITDIANQKASTNTGNKT